MNFITRNPLKNPSNIFFCFLIFSHFSFEFHRYVFVFNFIHFWTKRKFENKRKKKPKWKWRNGERKMNIRISAKLLNDLEYPFCVFYYMLFLFLLIHHKQRLSTILKPHTRMPLKLAKAKCSQRIPFDWVLHLTFQSSIMRFWIHPIRPVNWQNRLDTIPHMNNNNNMNLLHNKRKKIKHNQCHQMTGYFYWSHHHSINNNNQMMIQTNKPRKEKRNEKKKNGKFKVKPSQNQ